jgi:hypothetical protein
MPLGVGPKPKQILRNEDIMNTDTAELQAVEKPAEVDESMHLLLLSIDDLDIVAGGASLGFTL